ncbi:hypothetical protein H8699_10785 [Christensenellaceae bacterium NSJ-44]|uniref:YDG domain-containing protein n=1 Tax=Luoshenia tenuis TaxID=2763654 RepID=A0A926D1R5_9FIRM|nr:YDG domain-containing protein [Luoshenia tenuis]MBC8529914.1 hypothetical protein [Luoshenia tenuis]
MKKRRWVALLLSVAVLLSLGVLPATALAAGDTFTVTYMTNAGVEMGTLTYTVDDPANAFPTSGFGSHFPDFMARAQQKGGVYLSNDLAQRWYEDAAFASPATFPQGQAGENYTVYCKLTVGNIGAGSVQNQAADASYADTSMAILALSGQYVSGRNDGYEGAKAVFEKKVDGQWVEVPERYYNDSTGTPWPNVIWLHDVADSGVYRLKYFRYTATDNAGNALYYVDAYDATSGEYTVSISPVQLTLTGVTAQDRTCDGTQDVALAGGTLEGVLYGDDVSFALGTGNMADPYAGKDKSVTTNIQLTGAKAGNYVLTQPEGLTVTITCAAERVEEKPATCTQAGHTAYWYCAACDRYYGDEALTQVISQEQTVLAALGHSPEKVEAKAPTATEAGNIAYWKCRECGKVFSDEACTQEIALAQTVLPATGEPAPSPSAQPSAQVEIAASATPQTGDDRGGMLWIGVMLLAGAGIVAGTLLRGKERKVNK